MARRRKGGLSSEDKNLWAAVRRSITPLDRPKSTEAEEAPAKSASEADKLQGPRRPRAQVLQRSPSAQADAVSPERLSRMESRRIASGKTRIGRRIDLHGHDRQAAHRLVDDALKAARDAGISCVLIVTGKGRFSSGREDLADDGESGVLRRELPHWLTSARLRPIVRAYGQAHVRHGGAGAWYVLLRRKKQPG